MHAQSKARIRRKFCVIILTELLLGLGLVGFHTLKMPVLSKPISPNILATPHAPAEVISKSVSAGLPVRLKIPKIKVDAALDQVGLTATGELGVPKELAHAAWYAPGPRPGDVGNAVIDGHFGANNRSAVFDNLHILQKGDAVSVEDEKGTSTTFVVRELRTYNPDDDTASVFASSDRKAHLNLITCQGVWNSTQKSYSARLVVFTDKAAID